MASLTVRGGKPLYGTVRISGSKNAALPVLFATLITRGVSELYGIPEIGDVAATISLLQSFGATVSREGDFVRVDTRRLSYVSPSPSLVCRLRASTYLIGSCLLRFGRAGITDFGGCNFAVRPIDMHIAAARAFGALDCDGGLSLKKPHPAKIAFDKPSVGATVNALIMASAIPGESRLSGCAVEPHILTLVSFLNSAGAVITNEGNSFTVRGGRLHRAAVLFPPRAGSGTGK